MYNKTCYGIPEVSKITILQSLRISVLDLLDFSNAAANSLEIQCSIQELVKWSNCTSVLGLYDPKYLIFSRKKNFYHKIWKSSAKLFDFKVHKLASKVMNLKRGLN